MKSKYTYLANMGEIGKKTVYGKPEKQSFQLCRESWDGYECFAIRVMSDDGQPLKGITMTTDQAIALRDVLNGIDFERYKKTP